jgi:hypothetical protein
MACVASDENNKAIVGGGKLGCCELAVGVDWEQLVSAAGVDFAESAD